MNRIERGLLAGSIGTLALEIATYADMVGRARPSSEMPARAAEQLAKRLGIDLGDGEDADNRAAALGALLGYATGLGVATVVALGTGPRRLPTLKGAVVFGALAMACADAPMAALGVTEITTWSKADWAADALPHAAYGLAAVLFWNALTPRVR